MITGRLLTSQGQPLNGAEVQLLPKGGTAASYFATTDSAGAFTVQEDVSHQPLQPDKYVVLVTRVAPAPEGGMAMKNIVPPAYNDPGRALLTLDVQAGDTNAPPFELRSTTRR